MQTLLLVKVFFGLLIQRSLARLLDDRCGMAVTSTHPEWRASAWMAGIRNETQFLCGGTVIHKRFVLTAAHCIEGQGRLFVKLGAYDLSLPALEYRISHAEIHSGFSSETFQHDIGLLRLPLDVVYTAQIYPICIDLPPTTSQTEVEEAAATFEAYGWGKTQTGKTQKILHRVTLDRYDRSRCNDILYSPPTSKQICAGPSNRSTYLGDSGGPLIKELNYNCSSRLTQLGILSYDLGSCERVGIYTNVASYAEWIEEKIKAPYTEESWPTSPIPEGNTNKVPIIPPSETFDRAQLLVEPCGIGVSPRILGGSNAEPEAGAWMAAVYNGTRLVCGGTIIHKRFVLTSAACISLDSDLFVRLGAYDRRYPAMEYHVTKRIKHVEFEHTKTTNNIGLLQLSRDIQFSWSVHPICIILNAEVSRSTVESGYTFDAYGWGKTNDGHSSHLLQKITLDLYDRSKCYDNFWIRLDSSQICAGASVGDVCHGDKGGPLIKNVVVNGLTRQTQFGVISYGSKSCNGIGVYINVTSYVDWIVRNVRDLTDA